MNCGSALGHGCGPLLVAKHALDSHRIKKARIAIPGPLTTATLLLKLWLGCETQLYAMRFDRIMPAVASGEVDAGLIIHESRFTYQNHGLLKLVDLGDWWEQETGCAIPLGGIVARKALGHSVIEQVDQALGESIDYAWQNPGALRPFMRQHAQEMQDHVMDQHVALYVNQRTRDLGPNGRKAIDVLLEKAKAQGLIH